MPPDLWYLVDLLMEIGPTVQSEMGERPIDEALLYYWQRNHRRPLDPWEVDTLKHMSQSYMQGNYDGQYPNSVKPYMNLSDEEKIEKRKAAEDAALAAFFNRGRETQKKRTKGV